MRALRPFRLLFWIAVAGTSTMALLPHPPHLLPVDKQEHGLAFAVLTMLAALAYPSVRLRFQVAGLAAFGAAIELLQLIPFLGRDGDIRDWVADLFAAIAAACLIKLWQRFGAGSRHRAALAPHVEQAGR